MNERRRKAKVRTTFHTTVIMMEDGQLCWFETPDGFSPNDDIPEGVEVHGPFKTRAEAEADMRVVLLGSLCKITEGGEWNPEWDRPAGTVLQ